ncbi:carbohydrate kinase [Pedobacter sp. HMF7647]|uniref:Carbohydrate kinase n=1 Tax=Hufsiella arboris TaxID=2695275 RepID=A0A7K1YD00_9SPHI|nr:FGGY family carbohydrate kinase [Hufsiella arboris]MXV52290.1 carbohydrate kinase [Hufsiella arboris]
MPVPVIAIFDVGKTNKKLFLFDEDYRIVFERSARFTETVDEDGDSCENLESLRLSVFDSLSEVIRNKEFDIKAINFSTYGASLVYVDQRGRPLTPLYNYLKAYPEKLKYEFYRKYGDEQELALSSASPVLGSLNSGMQLYRLKCEQPEIFKKVRYALHLPQYMSSIITGKLYSDITSIGCHTSLWNFQKNTYQDWVSKEKLADKLAPIFPGDAVIPSVFPSDKFPSGVGLHDSSAALIPYLESFHEPFILISTGTWCISLNPFNNSPLTKFELSQDCLCYLSYKGKPVKASRLFAGYEHDKEVKRIAEYFGQSYTKYKSLKFDLKIMRKFLPEEALPIYFNRLGINYLNFEKEDLSRFSSDTEAYHYLIYTLIFKQFISTNLVLEKSKVKRIFVDGGFSGNVIYMNLLAMAFPGFEVYAASMAQATAMGAAVAIHNNWNDRPLPGDVIGLKLYVPFLKVVS